MESVESSVDDGRATVQNVERSAFRAQGAGSFVERQAGDPVASDV